MVVFLQRRVRRVIFLVLLVLVGVSPLHAQPSSAIRVLSPRLAAALEAALERSPTLQAIVAELEQSDVIVHVIAMPASLRHPHQGRLAFVTVAGARRFVRITIDSHLTYAQRASMLGHELYHAVEVARELTIVDRASFAQFYQRIGHPSDHGWLCFDTVGAQAAGVQVLAEVTAARAGRRPSAVASTLR